MDLRRLRYFLAVADHGGFTAASRAVFVAQPALSLAVKELEQELGAELFLRRGRHVVLTSAGQALVDPARQALRDVETGRAAVAAVTGLSAGSLTLCSLPSLAAEPTATFIGRFRRIHPAVAIDVAAPSDTAELFDMVNSGRCEVGVAVKSDLPDELVDRDLFDQELLLIFPPDSPPQVDPLPLWALDGVAMVATPVGSTSRTLFDSVFAEAGATPTISVVAAPRDAVLRLVGAGAGAAWCPWSGRGGRPPGGARGPAVTGGATPGGAGPSAGPHGPGGSEVRRALGLSPGRARGAERPRWPRPDAVRRPASPRRRPGGAPSAVRNPRGRARGSRGGRSAG